MYAGVFRTGFTTTLLKGFYLKITIEVTEFLTQSLLLRPFIDEWCT